MLDLAAHWAGYLGVALYLSSYALLQSGVLRGVGYTYTLMNLSAALLVLVSLAKKRLSNNAQTSPCLAHLAAMCPHAAKHWNAVINPEPDHIRP